MSMVENLRRDVFMYRAQIQGLARWLVESGFPLNWSSSEPAPFYIKEAVAHELMRRDGEDDLTGYIEMVEEAQAWR